MSSAFSWFELEFSFSIWLSVSFIIASETNEIAEVRTNAFTFSFPFWSSLTFDKFTWSVTTCDSSFLLDLLSIVCVWFEFKVESNAVFVFFLLRFFFRFFFLVCKFWVSSLSSLFTSISFKVTFMLFSSFTISEESTTFWPSKVLMITSGCWFSNEVVFFATSMSTWSSPSTASFVVFLDDRFFFFFFLRLGLDVVVLVWFLFNSFSSWRDSNSLDLVSTLAITGKTVFLLSWMIGWTFPLDRFFRLFFLGLITSFCFTFVIDVLFSGIFDSSGLGCTTLVCKLDSTLFCCEADDDDLDRFFFFFWIRLRFGFSSNDVDFELVTLSAVKLWIVDFFLFFRPLIRLVDVTRLLFDLLSCDDDFLRDGTCCSDFFSSLPNISFWIDLSTLLLIVETFPLLLLTLLLLTFFLDDEESISTLGVDLFLGKGEIDDPFDLLFRFTFLSPCVGEAELLLSIEFMGLLIFFFFDLFFLFFLPFRDDVFLFNDGMVPSSFNNIFEVSLFSETFVFWDDFLFFLFFLGLWPDSLFLWFCKREWLETLLDGIALTNKTPFLLLLLSPIGLWYTEKITHNAKYTILIKRIIIWQWRQTEFKTPLELNLLNIENFSKIRERERERESDYEWNSWNNKNLIQNITSIITNKMYYYPVFCDWRSETSIKHTIVSKKKGYIQISILPAYFNAPIEKRSNDSWKWYMFLVFFSLSRTVTKSLLVSYSPGLSTWTLQSKTFYCTVWKLSAYM